MDIQDFTLTFLLPQGLDPFDYENALQEAGCDDATLSWQAGMMMLDFSRRATSRPQAVASALDAVRRAVPDALPVGTIFPS